jgi:hypothetical protein
MLLVGSVWSVKQVKEVKNLQKVRIIFPNKKSRVG